MGVDSVLRDGTLRLLEHRRVSAAGARSAKCLCRSLDGMGPGNGGPRGPANDRRNQLNPKQFDSPRPSLQPSARLLNRYRGFWCHRLPQRRGAQQAAGPKAALGGHRKSSRIRKRIDRSRGRSQGRAPAKTTRPPLRAPRRRTSNTRTTGPQSSTCAAHLST